MGTKKTLIPEQKDVVWRWSAEEITILCGVSYRTACRWKSGAVQMDTASKLILSGDLSCFAPEWRGWSIRGETLYSPEGWGITMYDVLASRLHEAQLAAWRLEVSKLKTQLAESERQGYEDQPTPDMWEVQILAG